MQRIDAINRRRPDYYELQRLVELVTTLSHSIEFFQMSAENATLRHYSRMLTDQLLTFAQMEIDRETRIRKEKTFSDI